VLEPGKELLQLLVAGVGQAGNELEVFVGRQIVDEEAFIDESSRPVLPILRRGNVNVNFKWRGGRGGGEFVVCGV